MNIGALPMILGSVLIIAGIAQVFWQMQRTIMERHTLHQYAEFKPQGFKVQTAYPIMTMICVGALLLIVGKVAG